MNSTKIVVDWRKATEPVTLDQITDEMLAPIRAAADKSKLPQTVWPSSSYGDDFVGVDCLLTASAIGWTTPSDAEPSSEPILSVLPQGWGE